MKFLVLALALSVASFAFAAETKKEEVKATTTTTESHAADHGHVDAAKADHAHDASHHTEATKTTTKKAH